MKILFLGITGRLGYYALKALTDNNKNVVAVVTRPQKANIKTKLRGIIGFFAQIFCSKSPFFQQFLEGRKYDVVRLARKHKLPVYWIEDVRSATFWELYKQLAPDIIVAMWPQRIPQNILAAPKLGCINAFHTSYLPKHRSGSPPIWAIVNDEKETGVTVYYMDENFDTGDIILQRKIPILENDTGKTLLGRMCEVGSEVLAESIQLIEQGKVVRKPQDESEASYDTIWKGGKDNLIDWSKSHRQVYNLIRACSFTPFLGFSLGAYTYHNGEMLKIWEAEDLPGVRSNSTPGTVLEIRDNGIVIACGEGVVLIKTVQKAGKLRTRLVASKYAKKTHLKLMGE